MQRFNVPPMVHEPTRQPVEQFGMRRQPALAAKILLSRDDSAAEVHPPDAIYDDASGERIPAVNHPARQPETIARLIGRKRQEARWRVRLDGIARSVISAAFQNERGPRLRQ